MTEKDLLRVYQAHKQLLATDKNDCFTIEEAAKALDRSFRCKDLRKDEPLEFKTFLNCVCENVKKLIQPYIKTKATSSGFDQGRSVLLNTMKPSFPSGTALNGVHKRIKRIYSFVAYIEDEYRKDRDTPGSKKTNLVSARLNHPLGSEESEDEDDSSPAHDDQKKHATFVKHPDPSYDVMTPLDDDQKKHATCVENPGPSYDVLTPVDDDQEKQAACVKYPGPDNTTGLLIKRRRFEDNGSK